MYSYEVYKMHGEYAAYIQYETGVLLSFPMPSFLLAFLFFVSFRLMVLVGVLWVVRSFVRSFVGVGVGVCR